MTLAIEEKKYELEKMPEILRKEVEEYLNNFQARIIAANVRESRPYKDKSIVDTTYEQGESA
ncbi:hypothetical protein JOC37_002610 [Desulfohalotomaculum tongense]|uniref:hypothetical protein n=1 Tax=Desulforadius tongensis TaxID=1216062 RepID=UPI00195CB5B6|nr:hypothetical protein [Desulforadius tongensis]MBM7856177.1 hypothetical protein [Desulforadius tongensis]